MSFLRHPEILPSDGGPNPGANAPAHRLDEFPVGYSLAGCAPAEPAAASPTDHHFARSLFRRTMSFHRTACCGLTGCLSRGVHSRRSGNYIPLVAATCSLPCTNRTEARELFGKAKRAYGFRSKAAHGKWKHDDETTAMTA